MKNISRLLFIAIALFASAQPIQAMEEKAEPEKNEEERQGARCFVCQQPVNSVLQGEADQACLACLRLFLAAILNPANPNEALRLLRAEAPATSSQKYNREYTQEATILSLHDLESILQRYQRTVKAMRFFSRERDSSLSTDYSLIVLIRKIRFDLQIDERNQSLMASTTFLHTSDVRALDRAELAIDYDRYLQQTHTSDEQAFLQFYYTISFQKCRQSCAATFFLM